MQQFVRLGAVVAVLSAPALLAGCAGRVPAPRVHIDNPRAVEVRVPVAAPCVKLADVPPVPAGVGDQLTGEARHDSGVLAESVLQLRSAFDQARALLVGCGG